MDQLPLFKWRNCYGDVIASRFDEVITNYWIKVALPALHNAEAEVDFWAKQEGPAVFMHANMVDQKAVTAAAMCLSLQSIWERQFRAYLLSCAGHSDSKVAANIQHAPWDALQRLFEQLRGVPLRAFLGYPDLDLLGRLGNVCRHGAGKAANSLWRSHPEIWGDRSWSMSSSVAPPVEAMQIDIGLLERFVKSIAAFWQFVEYLYNESIDRKHPAFERTLPAQRQKFMAAIAHFNIAIRVVP